MCQDGSAEFISASYMRRIPDARSRSRDMADMPSRGTAPARGTGFILTHLISPCKLLRDNSPLYFHLFLHFPRVLSGIKYSFNFNSFVLSKLNKY